MRLAKTTSVSWRGGESTNRGTSVYNEMPRLLEREEKEERMLEEG